MKLQKGDKVRVMSGKDKGKDGVIDRIYPKQNRVLIQGVNLVKRHVKKSQELQEGGIIDLPKPVAIDSIALVCPQCEKPTRVGYMLTKGKKTRICRKCKKELK